MSTPELETFLARLYTDAQLRERFLRDPKSEALAAGLAPDQAEELARLDPAALEAACHSFARKRQQKSTHGKRRWFW